MPPAFAYRGVVIAETEEVAYYWEGTWDFRKVLYKWYICCCEVLEKLTMTTRPNVRPYIPSITRNRML